MHEKRHLFVVVRDKIIPVIFLSPDKDAIKEIKEMMPIVADVVGDENITHWGVRYV